eukprot:gene3253-biopygen7427
MTVAEATYVVALRESSVVFGAVLGWTVFGEPFSATRLAGVTLVVAGVVAIRLLSATVTIAEIWDLPYKILYRKATRCISPPTHTAASAVPEKSTALMLWNTFVNISSLNILDVREADDYEGNSSH